VATLADAGRARSQKKKRVLQLQLEFPVVVSFGLVSVAVVPQPGKAYVPEVHVHVEDHESLRAVVFGLASVIHSVSQEMLNREMHSFAMAGRMLDLSHWQ